MRNLVRGGIILVILSLCVIFIIAQTRPARVLSIAKDSQIKTEEPITETVITNQDQELDKDKLVKTTAMVKASSRASSRGSFTATAYCLKGRTALGGSVRRGVVAADPRLLRLGSTILLGAGSYSGQYKVADTGGAVRGKKLDIWVPSCSEARRFGRRTVTVSMLEN